MSIPKKTSLSMNFFMNMLLTMSSFIFPLITFPYISRVLQAEGNGKVLMATSFVAYFVMVAQLGIPTYGIRVCAAVRDNRLELTRVVHELAVIQMVMMVASYILFFLCLNGIPKLRGEKMLYIITSLMIMLSCVGVEWLFKALEQYTYITIRSLAFKIVSVAAMFLLVHSEEDYVIYAAINVMASAGSNVMNLTRLPQYVLLKPVGGYQIRRHLKPIFVLFAYVCATTIYTNLDALMLGFMTSEADVGYYGVAVKVKNILVGVVTAMGAVLLPRVAYYYEQRRLKEFWDMAAKAFHVVLLMAMPLTVYCMIFSRNVIFFLSGEQYAESIIPMIIIMPTLICIGLTSVTGIQILIPMRRENVVLYASVAGSLVDVVLNALLIPSMRSAGATIGTLAAELVVLVIHAAVLWKDIRPIFYSINIWKIAAATTAAVMAAFWIAAWKVSDFWILFVSAIVFFCVYVVVLYVCKEPFIRQAKEKIVFMLHARLKHKDTDV